MPAFPAYSHRPVLADEALGLLCPGPGGLYCDATLGGGGHSESLLLRSAPDGQVIGVDRDPQALAAAAERLRPFAGRFTPVHGRFGDLPQILAALGHPRVDGILADVGVSSPQLDQAERGFSFSRKGPIDMRMDPSQGETAADLIHRLQESALADVLYHYGEERRSRPIARALKHADAEGALTDTAALAAVIARAKPQRHHGAIHPATQSFQALRIAVNDELRQLDQLLRLAPSCLAPGGRLVVISFHSLEDRLVKHHLRALSAKPTEAAQAGPVLALLTRKPITPSDAEQRDNPRARSARLRAAVRLPVDASASAEAAA